MPIVFGIRLRRFYDPDGLILRDPVDTISADNARGIAPYRGFPRYPPCFCGQTTLAEVPIRFRQAPVFR